MRLKAFLNRSEGIALAQMERVLGGTGYRAYVKPRLKDVLAEAPNESLTLHRRRMLDHGHLDFLVVNCVTALPEFAVEFDGPGHAEPRQRLRDEVKDEMCLEADLPVLRIGAEDVAPREQCSMLEWLLERFLAYRQHYRPQRDRDGYQWVPAPAWEFDLEHTMPAIRAVIKRLHDEFGIVSAHWWAWGGPAASLSSLETAILYAIPDPVYIASLGLLPPHHPGIDVPDFRQTGEATVLLCRAGQDAPVYEAKSRITIPERNEWHGGMLDSIFGFAYEDAQASLAEYQALRDVERFALRNLVSVAA